MEWFRKFYQPPRPKADSTSSVESVQQVSLPSVDGLVIGVLIKMRSKDGLLACSYAAERYGCDVFVHRSLLESCAANIGDRLAFSIHENMQGHPQASAPIWKLVAGHPGNVAASTCVAFPGFIGILQTVVPSGESGVVESPKALEVHGRHVYIQRALLVEGAVEVGDTLAFDIRTNGKGNPHVAPPVFKIARRPAKVCTRASALTSGAFAIWEDFPSELLPWALAAAGPLEFCYATMACRTWASEMRKARWELEGFWRALCEEWYPSMVTKIVGLEFQQSEVHHDVSETFVGGEAGAAVVPDYWRNKFLLRYSKQRAWDAQRHERQEQQQQKQQRAERKKQHHALLDDRACRQDSHGDARMVRGPRPVRLRTCRRCALEFLPSNNSTDSCRWHRGKYVVVDDDGEAMRNTGRGSVIAEHIVQQAIRANNKKKKSKQPNALVPIIAGREGKFAWSCCGSESMIAVGCSSGPHS